MSKVRLYVFYNYGVGKQGEPFALCDECRKIQPIPADCDLRVLANQAVGGCSADWHVSKPEAH
jgi:hypothetical protein